jgi:hypothetical protein
VLIAVGIDWDGRRQILSVEMASRESRSVWKDFLLGLKARGLKGRIRRLRRSCRLVAAIGEVIPGSAAMCTSCAMRSTICRARTATIACLRCLWWVRQTEEGPRLLDGFLDPAGQPWIFSRPFTKQADRSTFASARSRRS